jgi:hypothetical protein
MKKKRDFHYDASSLPNAIESQHTAKYKILPDISIYFPGAGTEGERKMR